MSVTRDRLAAMKPIGAEETHAEAADPHVAVLADPTGAAAEQFRLLACRVEAASRASAVRVLAVTSAVAGEGRTTVACNLALALGRRMRVLLVDAHPRRPGVARALGLRPAGGVADVLAGRADIAGVLWRVAGSETYVLGAGGEPAPEPEAIGALVASERERFDLIVLDGPPLLPIADMARLGPACDAAVLVVRAGRTARGLVAGALEALRPVPLLGGVLNAVEARSARAGVELAHFDRRWRARPVTVSG